MKKIILTIMITVSGLIADANIGFLANQKYICVSEGIVVNDKLNPTPQKEALKYPMRFYIDDNNIMNTDAKLTLNHVKDTTYSNGKYTMGLIINNNKRYLVSSNKELEAMGAFALYVCVETNNWTIAR